MWSMRSRRRVYASAVCTAAGRASDHRSPSCRAYSLPQLLPVLEERHAEEVSHHAGRTVAVALVEANRALERLRRVERGARAAEPQQLCFCGMEQPIGNASP